MAALPYPVSPAESLPQEGSALPSRQSGTLWLALQLLAPEPDQAALESLATWAGSLTSTVVLRPDEGLLLEVQGSLRYFSGLAAIREQLSSELERRGWTHRLATAPTPLAATWLVRCASCDIADPARLAGAVGRLPIAATAWPERVQLMLRQMGLRSLADCLRLPRAGFARRAGRSLLDELDRALGRKPDPRNAWRSPEVLRRCVEFSLETRNRAWFAEALGEMADSLERELRQRQAQVASITLAFRHLRSSDTLTRIRFVEPVHERDRIFKPLLARLENLVLAEPAVALSLETSKLQAFRVSPPELLPSPSGIGLPAGPAPAVPEFALVECLRGRFGRRSVYGIGTVAEHRPERAWCHWIDQPVSSSRPASAGAQACMQGRPLWLLPEPRRRTPRKWCQTPLFSSGERIEGGWWDGQDVRRDYHVVVGAAGEKLWLYRDCRTQEWYLHGIFG